MQAVQTIGQSSLGSVEGDADSVYLGDKYGHVLPSALVAVCGYMQANAENGLSGSLNLGHYGVTQSNSFESVKVGGQGAELVTPFAKLQVPYQVRLVTSFCQGGPCRPCLSSRVSHCYTQPASDTRTMPVQHALHSICCFGST